MRAEVIDASPVDVFAARAGHGRGRGLRGLGLARGACIPDRAGGPHRSGRVRLAHPRAPKVLVKHGAANRIEVSLSREILVLYRNNKVQLISHVSTGGHYYYCSPGGGCGYAVTPTGNFRTVVFMRGWVHVPLGEMFNPVFFIGTAFAIHGDTDVPLAPVSHGCVRIPMDIANFFHKLVKVPGERVYIR
jgi:hypothetical protein